MTGVGGPPTTRTGARAELASSSRRRAGARQLRRKKHHQQHTVRRCAGVEGPLTLCCVKAAAARTNLASSCVFCLRRHMTSDSMGRTLSTRLISPPGNLRRKRQRVFPYDVRRVGACSDPRKRRQSVRQIPTVPGESPSFSEATGAKTEKKVSHRVKSGSEEDGRGAAPHRACTSRSSSQAPSWARCRPPPSADCPLLAPCTDRSANGGGWRLDSLAP